eukprot:g65431.t1
MQGASMSAEHLQPLLLFLQHAALESAERGVSHVTQTATGTLQEQERCCAVWQTALLEQEATLLSSIDPAHLALDPSSPSLAASPSIAQSLQSFRDAKSVSDKRLAVDAALSRVKEALSGVDSDATVGPPLKRQRKEPTPSLPHSVNETICRLFECTLEQYQLECNTAKFKVQNFTQLVKDVRQVLQLSADHRILDGERLTKATSLLDEAERKQASASSETEVEDVLVRPSRPEEEAAALEMIRGGILDLFPHSREKAETYLSKQDDLTDPRGLGAFYARGGGCFLVAEADGRLAGCVGMQPRLLMEEKWLPGKASNEKELEAMRKEMRSQMEVRRLSKFHLQHLLV